MECEQPSQAHVSFASYVAVRSTPDSLTVPCRGTDTAPPAALVATVTAANPITAANVTDIIEPLQREAAHITVLDLQLATAHDFLFEQLARLSCPVLAELRMAMNLTAADRHRIGTLLRTAQWPQSANRA